MRHPSQRKKKESIQSTTSREGSKCDGEGAASCTWRSKEGENEVGQRKKWNWGRAGTDDRQLMLSAMGQMMAFFTQFTGVPSTPYPPPFLSGYLLPSSPMPPFSAGWVSVQHTVISTVSYWWTSTLPGPSSLSSSASYAQLGWRRLAFLTCSCWCSTVEYFRCMHHCY